MCNLSLCMTSLRISPEHRNCTTGNTWGWKCDSGDCIPNYQICDQDKQCPIISNNKVDNSDESEGCDLYPGTKMILVLQNIITIKKNKSFLNSSIDRNGMHILAWKTPHSLPIRRFML